MWLMRENAVLAQKNDFYRFLKIFKALASMETGAFLYSLLWKN